jgi:CRISPR-associated protein Cmr5
MMSKRQTQEQERAKQAWENIHGDVKGKNFAGEYKSLVSSAPADIQTNGLGQTAAFWRSKGKDHHKVLYNHLSTWVMQKMEVQGDLMRWITQTDSRRYRQATVEALAFLGWLKRFAQAEL